MILLSCETFQCEIGGDCLLGSWRCFAAKLVAIICKFLESVTSMLMTKPAPHSALLAAKARWAAAQAHHALRGTPSREMSEPQTINGLYLGAKPLGTQAQKTPME